MSTKGFVLCGRSSCFLGGYSDEHWDLVGAWGGARKRRGFPTLSNAEPWRLPEGGRWWRMGPRDLMHADGTPPTKHGPLYLGNVKWRNVAPLPGRANRRQVQEYAEIWKSLETRHASSSAVTRKAFVLSPHSCCGLRMLTRSRLQCPMENAATFIFTRNLRKDPRL